MAGVAGWKAGEEAVGSQRLIRSFHHGQIRMPQATTSVAQARLGPWLCSDLALQRQDAREWKETSKTGGGQRARAKSRDNIALGNAAIWVGKEWEKKRRAFSGHRSLARTVNVLPHCTEHGVHTW